MDLARQDYIAPWWTYWLHNFPHVNLRFQSVDSDFKPEDANYQQVRGFNRLLQDEGEINVNIVG